MKDFEVIIYVVAAIIWLVSKNFRKVQQNRPGQKKQVPVSQEFIESELPPKPVKKPVAQLERRSPGLPEQPISVKSKTQKEVRQPAPASEESSFNYRAGLYHEEVPSEYEISSGKELISHFDLDSFDLRQAVIYAEIINRPYH
ncbi:MAG: hypothetical protein LC117_01145 [Bacteroidia bacterium]|nr:hypothetical protein [Bacteroidia bacterium]MCZ2276524.1 hypothetical protein [Bacteroidia bacterium]